jgi:hypothetical protein
MRLRDVRIDPMKTKFSLVLALLLPLASCYSGEATRNKNSMGSLKLGMTQDDVLKTMGPPVRSEATMRDKKQRMILYYITDSFGAETPVVIEDGKLIGWGSAAKE